MWTSCYCSDISKSITFKFFVSKKMHKKVWFTIELIYNSSESIRLHTLRIPANSSNVFPFHSKIMFLKSVQCFFFVHFNIQSSTVFCLIDAAQNSQMKWITLRIHLKNNNYYLHTKKCIQFERFHDLIRRWLWIVRLHLTITFVSFTFCYFPF